MVDSSRCGISVDIGTTNLTFHLTRHETGELAGVLTLGNPQRDYGEEIISRIDFARKPENASLLTEVVRDTVNDGINEILQKSNCDLESVDSVVIVGNTVMHHLFFGLSTSSLLSPPYRAEHKDSILAKPSDFELELPDEALCYSPPIIESFIGADAVAMMLASEFVNSDSRIVSIDVGTNTEIAVLNDGKIWIASAASGPAFEGMSIECGTSGDVGAIYRVQIDPIDFSPHYEVIGGTKPTGICGTGVISAIAGLLETGMLFPRGSFNRSRISPWLVTEAPIIHYILTPASESATNSNIVLTQPDVRMLQQSKASIRSALGMVLQYAQLHPYDVDVLYLTGVFGSGLMINDAIRIGLLPEMIKADVHQIVGGASIGADLMHKQECREHAVNLVSKTNYIELTDNPEFKSLFAKNLPFP
ncbi:MAG: ASKHA domain-containing protein [Candidatus Thorarchaeota archaeon]